MLRAALAVCCALCVQGDQSGMLKTAVDNIQGIADSLRDTRGQRRERALELSNIMQVTAMRQKINPEEQEGLALLDDLLSNLTEEWYNMSRADEAELQGIVALFDQCGANGGLDRMEELRLSTDGYRTTHATCRDAEKLLFDDHVSLCGSLTSFLGLVSNVDCIKPGTTVDATAVPPITLTTVMDDWELWFDNGYDHFKLTWESYVPKRDSCLDATAFLEAKIDECNGDQLNFENEFCAWRTVVNEHCADVLACFNGLVTLYDNTRATIEANAEGRVETVRIITYTGCLTETLSINGTNESVCEYILNKSFDEYGVTYPERPTSPQSCDSSVVDIYPGQVDFFQTYYEDTNVHHETRSPVQQNLVNCN